MNDQVKKSNFIKLDRRLVQVLGLYKAVVLCHLIGIQEAIKKTSNNETFYQTLDVLVYNLDISRQTLIKIIKDLEDLQLVKKKSHQQKNKNYYYISKRNYDFLISIIDDELKEKRKKNKSTKDEIKEKVIQNYISSMKIDTISSVKNDTLSSTKNDTTNKDLIEIKNKEKKIKSKDIKTYFNDLPYIKTIFSKRISENELYLELSKYDIKLVSTINYFIYEYKKVMRKDHKLISNFNVLDKLMEAIDTIYRNDDFCIYNDVGIMQDTIDYFIQLPNVKDPSLFVFTSNLDDVENSFLYLIGQRFK